MFLSFMDATCSGRTSCSYVVGNDGLNEYNPCLRDATAYLEVDYECIKGILGEQHQVVFYTCHNSSSVSCVLSATFIPVHCDVI